MILFLKISLFTWLADLFHYKRLLSVIYSHKQRKQLFQIESYYFVKCKRIYYKEHASFYAAARSQRSRLLSYNNVVSSLSCCLEILVPYAAQRSSLVGWWTKSNGVIPSWPNTHLLLIPAYIRVWLELFTGRFLWARREYLSSRTAQDFFITCWMTSEFEQYECYRIYLNTSRTVHKDFLWYSHKARKDFIYTPVLYSGVGIPCE